MRQSFAVTVVFLALSGPAIAACPVDRSDTQAGIEVAFSGLTMTYRLHPDGLMEEVERDADGTATYRFLSRQGVFVTDSWEMANDAPLASSHHQTSYSIPVTDLPEIQPGLRWLGLAMTRFADGTEITETVDLRVSPARQLTFGSCQYIVYPVELRYDEEGQDRRLEQSIYIPDLGIGLFLATGPAQELVAADFPLSFRTLTDRPVPKE